MKLFEIPARSRVLIVNEDDAWTPPNMETVVLEEDEVFEMKDIRVDPFGNVPTASAPGDDTIGGKLAGKGYYAFERDDGTVLLMHQTKVAVLQ